MSKPPGSPVMDVMPPTEKPAQPPTESFDNHSEQPEDFPQPQPEHQLPQQHQASDSTVTVAIVSTVIIVLTLSALATFAYLQTQ